MIKSNTILGTFETCCKCELVHWKKEKITRVSPNLMFSMPEAMSSQKPLDDPRGPKLMIFMLMLGPLLLPSPPPLNSRRSLRKESLGCPRHSERRGPSGRPSMCQNSEGTPEVKTGRSEIIFPVALWLGLPPPPRLSTPTQCWVGVVRRRVAMISV